MSLLQDLDHIPADEDINVAPPDQYVDGGFDLLPSGTYDLHLNQFDLVTLENGSFANAVDIECTVVGAPDVQWLGRKTGRLRVWTTRYERKPGVLASGLGDLIRGITDKDPWIGLNGAVMILQKAMDRAIPMQIKLDWEAFDKAGYDAAGGGGMEKKSPEQKALRASASVKGMRAFPPYDDGSFRSEVAGPLSGQTLTARLTIKSVIPQSKRKTLAALAA